MRRICVLVAVGAVFAALGTASAWAQTPPDDAEMQREIDRCMEGRDPLDEPPSLVDDGRGGWRCVDPVLPSGTGMVGWFIVFALLWAIVPMVIAGSVASSRGESVGLALALTLFLGWIGFAIVMFGLQRSASEAQRLVSTTAAPSGQRTPVADRLRVLEELRRDGHITDEEYTARRREIVSEI